MKEGVARRLGFFFQCFYLQNWAVNKLFVKLSKMRNLQRIIMCSVWVFLDELLLCIRLKRFLTFFKKKIKSPDPEMQALGIEF